MIPAPLPTSELKDLGEKLQQAIVLTRIRSEQLPASRVKTRTQRVLNNADKLFKHLSQTAQATSSLTTFLRDAMGVSVDDLFGFTDNPKVARGVAYAGIATVNKAISNTLTELAAMNAAIDKEVMKNGPKNKPAD